MNDNVLTGARELIAGFLKSRREELGLSQQALADRSGLGVMTIIRMEQARFWPNMKQFLIVCHHLDLFFFVEEKNSKKEMATLMRERWRRDGDGN